MDLIIDFSDETAMVKEEYFNLIRTLLESLT